MGPGQFAWVKVPEHVQLELPLEEPDFITERELNDLLFAAIQENTPANPKQAFGDKKAPLQVVPPALELGAARAYGEGAEKYGPFNWRTTKVEAMTYAGAIKRHLAAWIDGEDVDPESAVGKLHLEGIAASVGILLDCTYGGFLLDNRPPPGPAPAMVRTPETK